MLQEVTLQIVKEPKFKSKIAVDTIYKQKNGKNFPS